MAIFFLWLPVPRWTDTVAVTYVEADGSEKEVQAELGKNLMDVAHDNNIELEGTSRTKIQFIIK